MRGSLVWDVGALSEKKNGHISLMWPFPRFPESTSEASPEGMTLHVEEM
jgi:hypothetical protein